VSVCLQCYIFGIFAHCSVGDMKDHECTLNEDCILGSVDIGTQGPRETITAQSGRRWCWRCTSDTGLAAYAPNKGTVKPESGMTIN
jgi:hypothetical protein